MKKKQPEDEVSLCPETTVPRRSRVMFDPVVDVYCAPKYDSSENPPSFPEPGSPTDLVSCLVETNYSVRMQLPENTDLTCCSIIIILIGIATLFLVTWKIVDSVLQLEIEDSLDNKQQTINSGFFSSLVPFGSSFFFSLINHISTPNKPIKISGKITTKEGSGNIR